MQYHLRNMQMLKLKHVIFGTLEPPNEKKKNHENIIGFPNTPRLQKQDDTAQTH